MGEEFIRGYRLKKPLYEDYLYYDKKILDEVIAPFTTEEKPLKIYKIRTKENLDAVYVTKDNVRYFVSYLYPKETEVVLEERRAAVHLSERTVQYIYFDSWYAYCPYPDSFTWERIPDFEDNYEIVGIKGEVAAIFHYEGQYPIMDSVLILDHLLDNEDCKVFYKDRELKIKPYPHTKRIEILEKLPFGSTVRVDYYGMVSSYSQSYHDWIKKEE